MTNENNNHSGSGDPDTLPQLVPAAEAAKVLQVTLTTIHRWVADGTLAGVRLGSLWRVYRQALEDAVYHGIRTPEQRREQQQSADAGGDRPTT